LKAERATTAVVEAALANIGATLMGRNMFGGHPGPWDASRPWVGWWGSNPPFHHPVFVLTQHARRPLELQGGTTFTFVTGGIEAALEQAQRAALTERGTGAPPRTAFTGARSRVA
jgi:dihydrofolate reductase